MLKGNLPTSFVGFIVVAAIGYLVTSCDLGHVDYAAEYDLEVVNEAGDRVRIRLTGVSGVFDLNSRERRTFRLSVLGPRDSHADNVLVRGIGGIEFFDAGAHVPYEIYRYGTSWCPGSTDDTRCVYDRSDGATDRLFVAAPDRPFYLQRDQENPDLARLVITFVPTSESLEVVNESRHRARIRIAMRRGTSFLVASEWNSHYVTARPHSGIHELASGEIITLAIMSSGFAPGETPEGNRYARHFSGINFYDSHAGSPHTSYEYDTWWCDPDFANDTLCVFKRSDGTIEKLFVESPGRPFYLERDKGDPGLARLVITYVPDGG